MEKKLTMRVFKFIIFTWLASFVPAAYCQIGNSNSETICNITIYQEDGTFPGAIADEWQSKMIDSCPENYTNQDIIASCERFHPSEEIESDLFIPRTNNITKITYINKYCGYCNNENDTDWDKYYWRTWEKFRFLEDPCDNYTSKIEASDVDDFDKWIQTFLNNGMILESIPYRKKLQCFGKKNWPFKLISNVIPCLVSDYIYGQSKRMKSCQYYDKNGRSCNKMEFILDGYIFEYRDKNKDYHHLSEINLTGGDYVVETVNQDLFYMCKQIYQAGYWGKLLRVFISIALLSAYLIMNFNKRYLEIFSNHILYVYSIGSIVMSVLLTYIYLEFPVSNVSFYLAKIFWSYHFIWTMLIFIVFCNLAFCLCIRWEDITKGNTNVHYYSLFLFVFFVVLPVFLPLMYLNFLETYENNCPLIHGHMAVLDVVPPGNLEYMKLFLNAILSWLMPIIFFPAIICILIDMSCSNPDEVRSATPSRGKSPIFFLKMLLIMGFHFVLYLLCSGYYRNENTYTVIGLSINMDTVAQLSIDFHGVLVFFVFLTENTWINDILIKHGYKQGNTTQQNCNGATETTVQFQS